MNSRTIGITINGIGIGDDSPVRIMGIINLSGESFYKGSVAETTSVPEKARQMIEQGASILDIGGRSTAPAAQPISVEEEKERVVRALESLFEHFDPGSTLVSIDTQYTDVGKAAFTVFERFGKERLFIMNDVSCLITDPRMNEWVTDIGCPLVIMSSHGTPGDSLGIERTIRDLESAIEKLERSGFDVAGKLIIDPAIGHWIPQKKSEYDFELVAQLARFRSLGKPILVGISRKSFVGSATGTSDPGERLSGTLAATAIAVFNGAHIVRTHDVTKETIDAVLVASSVRKALMASVDS
jgi:dihydropteroate synthase